MDAGARWLRVASTSAWARSYARKADGLVAVVWTEEGVREAAAGNPVTGRRAPRTAGETALASAGHARNVLLPRGFAVPPADPRTARRAMLAAERTGVGAAVAEAGDNTGAALARLSGGPPVVVRVVCTRDGTALKAPVTAERILQEVRRQKEVELPPASLAALTTPLATLGAHSIPLALDPTRVLDTLELRVNVVKKRRIRPKD